MGSTSHLIVLEMKSESQADGIHISESDPAPAQLPAGPLRCRKRPDKELTKGQPISTKLQTWSALPWPQLHKSARSQPAAWEWRSSRV